MDSKITKILMEWSRLNDPDVNTMTKTIITSVTVVITIVITVVITIVIIIILGHRQQDHENPYGQWS